MKNTQYDVLIIGAGPAALTATIYTTRANLKTAFIEKAVPGGKLLSQSKIENYPGDKLIRGDELALRLFEHAREYGGEYLYGDVIEIRNIEDTYKELVLADGTVYTTKSVIIASGMVNRIPTDIINIDKFNHKGVSYCAICDGPLFKGQPMAIIGGGNSAIEEASYVASISPKVYVFVRDDIIAEKALVDELKSKDNVEIIKNSSIVELQGDNTLQKAIVKVNDETKEFEINALFPYIGFLPSIEFAQNLNILDKNNFVITDENMETSIPNIFAIGDVRAKTIRQITTATADGTIAAKVLTNRLS
ncbi:NAD(P)/FAD-dependent oxidoreductase [Mycoplasma phocoenae]|uniref:FAD-dependent oxidoreductase n=1 Tax=Mycoplasma phocoenae TaxID=754517 RepID=A0A858U279_9MOLU|nr:FAD-dependent oxidoreductase [Mycoplasma phocoenae]QJG67254.1 FAD-dependent oxidoreductase [Mycoplasma phocoenae]